MTSSKRYEGALDGVLAAASCGETSRFADDRSMFVALGSISNTEMVVAAKASAFLSLPTDSFRECITALAHLESRHGDNTHGSWYFVNTFSQLLSLYCRAIGRSAPPADMLAHLLAVRRNGRMPFGKDLDLSVRTLADYEAHLRGEQERRSRHATLMRTNTAATAAMATERIWKAIARHDVKGVESLLLKGADVRALSPDGTSMAIYADALGHADIAEMIRMKTGAETEPQHSSGRHEGTG